MYHETENMIHPIIWKKSKVLQCSKIVKINQMTLA